MIHPYLTYFVSVWSSTYRINLKIVCTEQKRSVRALFETAQQQHSKDIFLKQKILPLDKLLHIFAWRFSHGHYQLRSNENLRIPLHTTTHIQLFISYRTIKT